MSDKSPNSGSILSLASGTSIIFFGGIAGRVLALGGQILVVRSLEPSLFGVVALAFTIILFISRSQGLAFSQGVTRLMSASDSTEEEASILSSGYLVTSLLASLITATVYFSRGIIAGFMNEPQLVYFLTAFTPYVILFVLAQISIGALRSREQSTQSVVSKNLVPYIIAILLFLIIDFIGATAFAAVIYWTAIPVFTILTALIFVHKNLSVITILKNGPSLSKSLKLSSFSIPLMFETSFSTLMSNLDVLMIGYYLTSNEVGLYRAIQPLREVTLFALISTTFLYLPIATNLYENRDFSSMGTIYSLSTKWIVVITLPPSLVIAAFSPAVVETLFGAEYLPSSLALTVLVSGLLFRVVAGPTGTTLKSINKAWTGFIASSVGLVVNFGLNVLLIPRYGIVGAAMATVISFSVYNITELIFIYHYLSIHPFSLDLIKVVVVTATFVLILRVLLGNIGNNILNIIVIGSCVGIIELITIIVTNSVSDDDLVLIEGAENKLNLDLSILKGLSRYD